MQEEFDLEQIEPKIIKTQDENGEIHNFELIDIIHLDNQDYGLLVYMDENKENIDTEAPDEEDEGEEEVVIMKLSKQDDAYTFETIDDDEEFNKVIAFLESEGEIEVEE